MTAINEPKAFGWVRKAYQDQILLKDFEMQFLLFVTNPKK